MGKLTMWNMPMLHVQKKYYYFSLENLSPMHKKDHVTSSLCLVIDRNHDISSSFFWICSPSLAPVCHGAASAAAQTIGKKDRMNAHADNLARAVVLTEQNTAFAIFGAISLKSATNLQIAAKLC